MSIDIYMYAEHRRNGVWTLCSPAKASVDAVEAPLDIPAIYEGDRNEGNYPLARALMDAACARPESGSSKLIPRGWPDDLSPELRKLVDWREQLEWMCNYPSWLLLRELLEIPWETRTVGTTGFVDAEQYVLFRQTGRPTRFASTIPAEVVLPNGGVGLLKTLRSVFGGRSHFDPRPRQITHAEMDQLVAEGKLSTGAITEITYQTPYAEYCPVFLQQTLPLLKTFGEPDDVRIVFWF